ncbi:DgyrCDS12393 [Dimorphilus gyrociliatus]|uniref:DgyrCDS12393 n=1 Tax=Dimorphilus gyrociliatus TaxID=2664684 RepID=A0A7I8W6B8_9ANNE|nr:DgyrCDS12393 [Dimorphilus gyrociliatus]
MNCKSAINGKAANREKSQIYPRTAVIDLRKDAVYDILAGNVTKIPEKKTKYYFISFQFNEYFEIDMKAERNYFINNIYPELIEKCLESNLDFNVIDMRWGVTDSATNEHSVTDLCLGEVDACKNASISANFVVGFIKINDTLIGDRYGFRPIPNRIEKSEFDILLEEALEIKSNSQLLLTWYRLDKNTIPQCYRLQAITTKLPDFGNERKPERARKATDSWNNIYLKLTTTLRECSESAFKKNRIDEKSKRRYFISVTELEIEKGLEDHNKFNIISYTRTFQGLDPHYVNEATAERFIDCKTRDSKLSVDEEVRELRRELKENFIVENIPKSNRRHFDLSWKPGGVDEKNNTEHRNYLRALGDDFKTRILNEIKKFNTGNALNSKYKGFYSSISEIQCHIRFAFEKTKYFCGQDKELNRIRRCLERNQSNNLVLFGKSGVGKTSLLAKIFLSLNKWMTNDTIKIIRFLGTTAETSSSFSLVKSVTEQLLDYFSIIPEPFWNKTLAKLSSYFPRLLRRISRKLSNQRLIIILDSLDQLTNNVDSIQKWLPSSLPQNISLIVSVLDENIYMKGLKTIITKENAYIKLESLPKETAELVMNKYLSEKKHTLTELQRIIILQSLQYSSTPLFLMVQLNRSLYWTSYTSASSIPLLNSVNEAINNIFDQIELKIGKLVTARILGLLSVSLNGLTIAELEDILSLDDQVLNELFQYHDPPYEGIVRFPQFIIIRLLGELRDYLSERSSFKRTTIAWYHKQFKIAALERYTSDKEFFRLNDQLAQYFMIQDQVQRDIYLEYRRKTIKEANRAIRIEKFSVNNRRKSECVIYHLRKAKNFEILKTKVFCNLDFLFCRMEFLVSDLQTIAQQSDDLELETLKECINTARDSAKSFNKQSLATQLCCRLPLDSHNLPNLYKLSYQCKEYLQSLSTFQIIPLSPALADHESVICNISQASSNVNLHYSRVWFLIKKSNEKHNYTLVNSKTGYTKTIVSKTLPVCCDRVVCFVAENGDVIVNENTSDCIQIIHKTTESIVSLAITENGRICFASSTNVKLFLPTGKSLQYSMTNFPLPVSTKNPKLVNFLTEDKIIYTAELESEHRKVKKVLVIQNFSSSGSCNTLPLPENVSNLKISASQYHVCLMFSEARSNCIAIVAVIDCQILRTIAFPRKIKHCEISFSGRLIIALDVLNYVHLAENDTVYEQIMSNISAISYDVETNQLVISDDLGNIKLFNIINRQFQTTKKMAFSAIEHLSFVDNGTKLVTIIANQCKVWYWKKFLQQTLRKRASMMQIDKSKDIFTQKSIKFCITNVKRNESELFLSSESGLGKYILPQGVLQQIYACSHDCNKVLLTCERNIIIGLNLDGNMTIWEVTTGKKIDFPLKNITILRALVSPIESTVFLLASQPNRSIQLITWASSNNKIIQQVNLSRISQDELNSLNDDRLKITRSGRHIVMKISSKQFQKSNEAILGHKLITYDTQSTVGDAITCKRNSSKYPLNVEQFEVFDENKLILSCGPEVIIYNALLAQCEQSIDMSQKQITNK